MEKKCVLVTGIGGNVGQGILRNIRDSFPDVYLVGTNTTPFSAGNYLCDKTYCVPFAFHENYIAEMTQIIKAENIDLVIPSTDYEVYYLSLNQSILNTKVAASAAETAHIYLDKYLTFLHHSANNIPFAKSWLPKEYDFSENEIIAKPREGRGSRGILLNPTDINTLGDDYMIQPLYKGLEITTAVYVTQHNQLHGIFTMKRELSNGTTIQSNVVFEYDEQLLPIVRAIITAGNFRGSFNLQSIVTVNGDIVPFEVNCRISGTNSIRHNLGFQDVKYTLQEYLFNEVPDTPKPINGIATRILVDIIYPYSSDENVLNNKASQHIIF